MLLETIILSALPLTILGVIFWNIRRKERKLLLQLANASEQNCFDWKINSSFHHRIIGSYRSYKVAIGIYELKSDSIVAEIFIQAKHSISIKNPKSFTYRKDKNLNGIWLGVIHTSTSKPTAQLFDIIIDDVIVE